MVMVVVVAVVDNRALMVSRRPSDGRLSAYARSPAREFAHRMHLGRICVAGVLDSNNRIKAVATDATSRVHTKGESV